MEPLPYADWSLDVRARVKDGELSVGLKHGTTMCVGSCKNDEKEYEMKSRDGPALLAEFKKTNDGDEQTWRFRYWLADHSDPADEIELRWPKKNGEGIGLYTMKGEELARLRVRAGAGLQFTVNAAVVELLGPKAPVFLKQGVSLPIKTSECGCSPVARSPY